jgi:hypothetical protein
MRRPLVPSSPGDPVSDRDIDDQGDQGDQAALAILQAMHRIAATPAGRFLSMHELREHAERFEEPARRSKSQGTAVAAEKINRSFACGRRGARPLS